MTHNVTTDSCLESRGQYCKQKNTGPLLEISHRTVFAILKQVTMSKYSLSSFLTVLWHPVCGLCCWKAVVFFQYLVSHCGPI